MNKVFVMEKYKDVGDKMTECFTGCSSNTEERCTAIFANNKDVRDHIAPFLRKFQSHFSSVTQEEFLNLFISHLEDISLEESYDLKTEEIKEDPINRFDIIDY